MEIFPACLKRMQQVPGETRIDFLFFFLVDNYLSSLLV